MINSVMKTIVIYPGRFQPMLSHHAEVYKQLQTTFPNAEIYIGTSDKVEPGKSPFNFNEKQIIAQAHGIDPSKVLPAKVPYVNASYTQFDQDEVSVIFAVGEKDYEERFSPKNLDPKTGIDMKKNGEPYYYQMINSYNNNPMPMSKRGYIYIAPNISSENEIASASAFRNAIANSPDKESAKEIVNKQFSIYSDQLFNLLYNKIKGSTMSEDINKMRQLAGMEPMAEAPAVEFETTEDPKTVIFLDAGKSSSKMSIANRFPEGVDVNDPEVKKEEFLKALLKSPEALLMEINERLDPKDENSAAVGTKLTSIIDGMRETGIQGLDSDDRQFVITLTGQAIKNMTLVAGDDSPEYKGEPPVKAFDFEGIDLSSEESLEEGACPKCGKEKHVLKACASCGCSEGVEQVVKEYEEDEPGSMTRYFLEQDFAQMSKEQAGNVVANVAYEVFPSYDMHEDPLDGALDLLHDLLDSDTMSGYEYDGGEMDNPDTSAMELSDNDYKRLPKIQQIVRAKYIERMNDPDIKDELKDYNFTNDKPQELPGMNVPQEEVEEGKLPAGLQAYQDKKNGKKADADKDEDKEVDEDKDEDKEEVDEAILDNAILQLKKLAGI